MVDSAVYRGIGILGIVEYVVILILALLSAYGARSKKAKCAFVLMGMFAIFELPRYCAFLRYGNYTTVASITYACHLISSMLFFMCFSFISLLLDDVLSFTSPSHTHETVCGMIWRLIFEKKILFAANVTFAVFVFAAIEVIVTAPSLSNGLTTSYFEIYLFIEGFYNLLYSTFIIYSAIEVRNRLKRMAISGTSKSLAGASSFLNLILMVARKLVAVAVSSGIASAIRIAMVLMEYGIYDGHFGHIKAWFPRNGKLLIELFVVYLIIGMHIGWLWFLFSDIIPSGLPCFTFIYVFGIGTNVVNRKQIAAAAKSFEAAIEVEMNVSRPTEEYIEPLEEIENPITAVGSKSRPVSSCRSGNSRPVSLTRYGMDNNNHTNDINNSNNNNNYGNHSSHHGNHIHGARNSFNAPMDGISEEYEEEERVGDPYQV